MLQSNEKMLAMCRTSIHSSSEMMNESLGGVERLQNVQARAVSQAVADCAPILKQIESSRTFDDLMLIQSNTGRVQLEKLMAYWADLFATAGVNQTQLIRRAQSQSLEIVDSVSGHCNCESGPVPNRL